MGAGAPLGAEEMAGVGTGVGAEPAWEPQGEGGLTPSLLGTPPAITWGAAQGKGDLGGTFPKWGFHGGLGKEHSLPCSRNTGHHWGMQWGN